LIISALKIKDSIKKRRYPKKGTASMKKRKPLCFFVLSLKKGKNFKVTFGIPKEKNVVDIIAAAPITRVNPNSSALKTLGNRINVLIAPIIIPK